MNRNEVSRSRHAAATCIFALCLLGGLCMWLSGTGNGVRAEESAEPQALHWSFRPISRPDIPKVKNAVQVRNAVDALLLDKLEQADLALSPEASRRTLIRRLSFDLTGLPPTPEEIDKFVTDTAPDAYERLVERLLESPHYGENWGRMWLDAVRYAETAGYNADPLRPNAWKYRDYVIRAFNEDRPFDRFVQEQIAGDEMFPDDPEAVVGSGYVLLWPDESNASNILLARQDALNDLTGNVGAVFLGVSIGCAQCHNHKFDPLLQKDFYRLQAFFSGIIPRDGAPVGTAGQLAEYQRAVDAWMAEGQSARDELRGLQAEARLKVSAERRLKFPQIVLDALDTPAEQRTTYQQQLAFFSERQIEIKEDSIVKNLSDDQKQRRRELVEQLAAWQQRKPVPPSEVVAIVPGEASAMPPPTFMLAGGSYNKPREEVSPGYLSVLYRDGGGDAVISTPHPRSSGRRTALARWLTDAANPLVARVMANRVWQGHFGVGLVENANDFGTQTAPPSHPELLDYLATELVRGGWSLKKLHRLIVSSSAYRQSTRYESREGAHAPRGATADPGNRLYWHYPRQRLTGEEIRDSLLAVSGQLNETVHGPSVCPEMPKGYSSREAWKVSSDPADRCRRSVYIHAKRNLPYPFLEAFDLPDMHESCARRVQTTVAPQALFLLNSDLVLDFGRSFAARLLHEISAGRTDQVVQRAYLLAFGREPTSAEQEEAQTFIERQTRLMAGRQAAGETLTVPRDLPESVEAPRAAALADFCHALFNASEFLYVE